MMPLPSSLSASLLALLALAVPADGWLGIHFDPDRDEAVVADVIAGWPAAKAGIQVGDVLLAVGDKKTPTREDFIAAIKSSKTGEDLTIKLRRGDEKVSVTVRLTDKAPPGATPSAADEPRKPAQAPVVEDEKASGKEKEKEKERARGATSRGYLGVTVGEDDGKVVVSAVNEGSPAAAAKVRSGDVIVGVGGKRVGDLGDLDVAMRDTRPGQKVAVELHNDDGTRSVTVTMGERPADSDQAEAQRPERLRTRTPRTAPARPGGPPDVEAELQALRKELAEVKKLLEEMRAGEQKGESKNESKNEQKKAKE